MTIAVSRLWDAVASWMAGWRWPVIIAQQVEYAPTGDEAALLVTRPGRRSRLHILSSRDQLVTLARIVLDGERDDLHGLWTVLETDSLGGYEGEATGLVFRSLDAAREHAHELDANYRERGEGGRHRVYRLEADRDGA
jgi:hypothetical protein